MCIRDRQYPDHLVEAIKNVSLTGLTLNPELRLGYLVPYKGKVKFQASYMGKVDILIRTGVVKDIYSDLVYANDEFSMTKGTITVVEDFMREECDQLNPVFFHYITTKTPYVVMKYAMTLDGKIATKTGASKWITGESARKEVQHMRHQYMGIMAGIGTVLADDPMLNVRVEGWKSPVRIVCDSKLRIPPGSQIVKSAEKYRTIVAYAEQKNAKEKIKILHTMGVETIYCPDEKNQIDLKKLMADLGNRGIDSILLEGGGTLNDSALRAGIVKEVQAFVAPKLFGGVAGKTPVEGIGVELPSEAVELKYTDICQIGEDIRIKCQVCDKKQEESCLQES